MRSPMFEGATYLGAGQLQPTADGFRTVGDMGWLDDDGYLHLADRRVDLILSGGANVFPAEVETALIDHPAVADVVVIGLPDADWGQRVHAVVAPKPRRRGDVRRDHRLRQGAARRLQGAEVGGVRRRDPAQRGDQGEPAGDDRRAPGERVNDAPFEGVRVVELAQWVFVPVAGALLADWGADVVRIERPEGDPYRGLATQGIGSDSGGVNLSIALANRGKRSIALDLSTAGGLDVLHELLAGADVFLTSLRPGALARLGLDADQLTARYPSLVYARGHGFGARGPDADQPGYDASAFWARGGLADALTPPGSEHPINPRGALGDRNGAMALAFGIAGALLRKARTGAGSVVDVSLLATAMWTLSSDVLTALQGAELPRPGDRSASPNPLVGTYRTSDGRHLQLVYLQGDRYWADLCTALGTAGADRRSAVRRHGCPPCQLGGMRRVARRGVRPADLRGVHQAARIRGRPVGARAVGQRAARRSTGDRQRLPR